MCDISVIIPMYNVEKYLRACINSLLPLMEAVDTEVILVDDGSTDWTAAIALEYLKNHNGFSLYQNKHRGLSSARNFGVARACGRYLLFVDADDIIVPEVYAEMLHMADLENADMAICRHLRLRDGSEQVSSMCLKTFYGLESSVSNIREHPQFAYAVTVWDKLIRRSFYEEHSIRFPDTMIYEDYPTTMRMFLLAEKVAVCWKTGYLWRISSGEPSLSQKIGEKAYFSERFRMFRKTLETVQECGDDTTEEFVRYKLFIDSLNSALSLPEEKEPGDNSFFVETAAVFLESIEDESILRKLPAIYDQLYQAYRNRDSDSLKRLAAFYQKGYGSIPYQYDRSPVTLRFPGSICDRSEYSIENEDRMAPPKMQVREVRLQDTILHIYGYLFRSRIQACKEYPQEYRAMLLDNVSERKYGLKTEPFETPDLTKRYGHIYSQEEDTIYTYNYDLSGFHFTIDLESVAENELLCGDCPILNYHRSVLEEGTQIVSGLLEEVKAELDRVLYSNEDCEISLIIDRSGAFFVKKPSPEKTPEERSCKVL